MNITAPLSTLLFFILSSEFVSGIILECKTGTIASKEAFELSSQSIKRKISGIWACGKYAPRASYDPCIESLDLDRYYLAHVSKLNESDFVSESTFTKAIEACGAVACKEINLDNIFSNDSTVIHLIRIEIPRLNGDAHPTEKAMERDSPVKEEKSGGIEFGWVFIGLGMTGLIAFIIFIILRIIYPIKADETGTFNTKTRSNRNADPDIVYNPDAAVFYPINYGAPVITPSRF